SGFLIVYMYYDKVAPARDWLQKYFTNRFARIYPVYFLLLTITVLLQHDFRPLFLLKNYTLTHALVYNLKDVAIQPSWSLTVEECFYFFAPLIMLIARRYHFFKSLLLGIALLLGALLITRANITLLRTPLFVFRSTFFGHFLEFYAGMFVALLALRRDKTGAAVRSGAVFTIAGGAGAAVVIAVLLYLNAVQTTVNPFVPVLINNFILPIPIAILYYGLISEKTLASRFLSSWLLGLLGRTSYSFYLVHMLVIDYLAMPWLLKYFGVHYNLFVLATYLLAQLAALVLFLLFEEPLNIYIRKKFKPRRKAAVVAAG
ncbi:MAG TPA: acyltransferase family protein, partial [Chitinophagaceae bacterium]|nr:acyltransferase family protein [Chitinophagaceae bacterium]